MPAPDTPLMMKRDPLLIVLAAVCVLALVVVAFVRPAPDSIITALATIGGGAIGRLSGVGKSDPPT